MLDDMLVTRKRVKLPKAMPNQEVTLKGPHDVALFSIGFTAMAAQTGCWVYASVVGPQHC